MQSYLNDTKLKSDFIEQIKWHQDQDKIIQGTYGEGSNGDFKACAVGCSIHSLGRMQGKKFQTDNHKLYESELGIPEWLAMLEDTIFEGLPIDDAKAWPLRFSEAVPVGVDLDPIKWQFCAFVLSRNIERVLTLKIDDSLKETVVSAIRQVLHVHETALNTGVWNESAAWSAESAQSAQSAAWSAQSAESTAESARSAAWSAAWSAQSAQSAAWSAQSAESAAESARSAAWSAQSAQSAAWAAEYRLFADKLIELLKLSAPAEERKS